MFMDDLRGALRGLSQRPVFLCVIIFLLALGIGATTTIFSIVRSVFWAPLPYQDGGEGLVYMSYVPEEDRYLWYNASYQDLLTWQEQSQLAETIAVFSITQELNLTGELDPERVRVGFVSASYFNLLGVYPTLGRTFAPEDENPQSPIAVALLTQHLWQNRFASDPDVVGKVVRLHDRPFTIVGVLPRFPDIYQEHDLYVPVTMARVTYRPGYIDDRQARWLNVVGRVKPGVTVEQLQEEMSAVATRLQELYPQNNEGLDIKVDHLRRMRMNFDRAKVSIITLLGGAAFVLLISCANVSNLMFLRMLERRKEIALRVAMGASQPRLLRQFVIEGLIMSLLAGVLGIIASYFFVALIEKLTIRSTFLLPFIKIHVDLPTLAVALALSILVGVIVSVIPAKRGLKFNLQEDLQQEGKSSVAVGRSWTIRLLTVSTVFLSVVLLVESGLILKTLKVLRTDEPGFATGNLLTARFELPTTTYSDQEDAFNVYRRLLETADSLPGVEAAGLWGPGVPGYSRFYKLITRDGYVPESSEGKLRAFEHRVSPGILTAMGISVVQGRDFTLQDDSSHPPVALVGEWVANHLWPGENPLGRRFFTGPPQNIWVEVIGVVKDVKQRGRLYFGDSPPCEVYFSILQIRPRAATIVLKTAADPDSLRGQTRTLLAAIDPDVPIFEIRRFDEYKREEEDQEGIYLSSALSSIFAGAALILSVTGIFIALNHAVQQRRREIGIRMSLGATKAGIFRQFITEGMIVVAVGLVTGFLGALAMAQTMAGMVYGISIYDGAVYVGVVLVILVVGFFGNLTPARAATRVEPSALLRL